jgi:hypothetical protein
VPGLLLLPSKKSRLRPAQYNSQYSTQIAQKRAISEFSTSGVPPVPWVVDKISPAFELRNSGVPCRQSSDHSSCGLVCCWCLLVAYLRV